MPKALITGIAGQDGSYLAELLLGKEYQVHGIVRPETLDNSNKLWRIAHVLPGITLHGASLKEGTPVEALIKAICPDEIYHLASSPEVQFSSSNDLLEEEEELSADALLSGAEAVKAKFFYASSAKVFGLPKESPQSEITPFAPISPYGRGKVRGMKRVENYRDRGLHASSGILFNHESPRRDNVFLPKKVTLAAARIKRGLEKEVHLGNLDSTRDWGFAGDYVRAMWLMLQSKAPADYVIGTGVSHSIEDLLEIAFGALGLKWQDYVVLDQSLAGPPEAVPSLADPSKIKRSLGWKPEVSFEELIRLMVREDMKNCL